MGSRTVKNLNGISIAEILQQRAAQDIVTGHKAFTFIENGGKVRRTLTYRELHLGAMAIAAELKKTLQPGSRVLLLYNSSLEFCRAFFGCLYAGMVAVPAYPPHPKLMNRMLPRILTVIRESDAGLVISDSPVFSDMKSVRELMPELKTLGWVLTDQIANAETSGGISRQAPMDQLALIQFTSGSTGAPKGVMISHGNLAHNCSLIHRCGTTPDDIGVNWTPVYHDMGLIFGMMYPIFSGFPMTLMSPLDFLMKPIRWLQEISELKATLTSAPNFAYDLCARKVTEEQLQAIDLSSLTMASVGAEPVRAESLNRFSKKFAACGFNPNAFQQAYGMAESTLVIASDESRLKAPVILTVDKKALEENRVETRISNPASVTALVGSGKPMFEMRVEIVDPATLQKVSDGQIGEIWAAGPSIAQGYWKMPEETKRDFNAHLADSGEGPFMRTGDLGVKWGDQIFITGRIKDMIIVHGKNYYPHDLESAVETANAPVRPGCVAAFAIEEGGEEKIVVVAEIERRHKMSAPGLANAVQLRVRSVLPGFDPNEPVEFDPASAIQTIRRNVTENCEVSLHSIVLIEAGSIPKTSSGKIQRRATKAAFLRKELKEIHSWHAADILLKAG
jgi:acyl-CoA synthetase (AMP-forming)/AMP-acid ligase II